MAGAVPGFLALFFVYVVVPLIQTIHCLSPLIISADLKDV
jgi:hypothetical protein